MVAEEEPLLVAEQFASICKGMGALERRFDAITPREQGEAIFELLGLRPRFRHVPVKLLDAVVAVLDLLGRASPALAERAELARIGRYYATEPMLVYDQETETYDASATPSTGSETLFDYYRDLIEGGVVLDRGDHAVF